MNRFLKFFAYGIVVILLESTIFSDFPASTLRFDFILMAVVTLALSENVASAIPSVLMLGVLSDAASAAPFGLSIFALIIVYGFIRLIIAKITVDTRIARFVWVAFASFSSKIVGILLILAWSGNLGIAATMFRYSFPQAIFDGITGLFMIPFIIWYDNLTIEKIMRPKKLVLK